MFKPQYNQQKICLTELLNCLTPAGLQLVNAQLIGAL